MNTYCKNIQFHWNVLGANVGGNGVVGSWQLAGFHAGAPAPLVALVRAGIATRMSRFGSGGLGAAPWVGSTPKGRKFSVNAPDKLKKL